MEKTELLACPFCGGAARIQGRGHETYDYRVYCGKCGCSTQSRSHLEEKAVYDWNHRTPSPDNKALTVGERIRQSDKSLAEFLASGTPDEPWPHCTICVMHKPGMCTGDTDCKRALLLSLSRQ